MKLHCRWERRAGRGITQMLGLIMVLGMWGCGYQFSVEGSGPVIGGGGKQLPEGNRVRLAMETLKNQTFQPTLEFKYTQYLRQAFSSSGGAKIIDDRAAADFILQGAILSVKVPTLAFSNQATQESRVQVEVAVRVRDQKTKKVRWSQKAMGMAEYFVGASSTGGDAESGLQFNRVLQDRAIEQAGQLIAANLADRFYAAREQGRFQVGDVLEQSPVADEVERRDAEPRSEDFIGPSSLTN